MGDCIRINVVCNGIGSNSRTLFYSQHSLSLVYAYSYYYEI